MTGMGLLTVMRVLLPQAATDAQPWCDMIPFISLTDALTPEECGRLCALAEAASPRPAGLVGGQHVEAIRRAELVWLDDLPDAAWAMDRMVGLVARANREGFGFDLSDFGESAQIARYGADRQGHFDWHSDIGAGIWAARRKLTVVVQLSPPEDYAGGVLEIRPDSNVQAMPRAQGTAVIFPSFVLHRVTPVTAGKRLSLTLWAHGPAFR
jgi:PKHD-type hydroxylase